jgi:hypothetical protein
MLETIAVEDGTVQIRATIRRFGIYLDNFAVVNLAMGPEERRRAFWRLCDSDHGGDLLFSPLNAAELIGSSAPRTLERCRHFLDGVGPSWCPVESPGIMSVLKREAAGAGKTSCISNWFLERMFAVLNIVAHGEQRIELVPSSFFTLGTVIEWVQRHRDETQAVLRKQEQVFFSQIKTLRTLYERKPERFQEEIPRPSYDASRPATFAFWGLLRILIEELKGYQLKRGDLADLCHATIAASYGKFAALDKEWKRRVESLPKPNDLARVYYGPQIDVLLADVEEQLDRRA